MKIRITTTSAADLSEELLKKFKIKKYAMNIILGDDVLLDGETVDGQKIFDYVKKTKILPKTSAYGSDFYESFFETELKGYDAIIHVELSSGISASCESSSKAADAINEKYGSKKIFVVDSLSLSTGIGLVAVKASMLNDGKRTAEQIVEELEAIVPKVQASFVLDKLDFMRKGGRCSTSTWLVATALMIKPRLVLSGGKIVANKKYFGTIDSALKKYFKDIIEEYSDANKEMAFITYTTANGEIVDYLKAELKNLGFKNLYITVAGATITSHCGDGTLGVLFINN